MICSPSSHMLSGPTAEPRDASAGPSSAAVPGSTRPHGSYGAGPGSVFFADEQCVFQPGMVSANLDAPSATGHGNVPHVLPNVQKQVIIPFSSQFMSSPLATSIPNYHKLHGASSFTAIVDPMQTSMHPCCRMKQARQSELTDLACFSVWQRSSSPSKGPQPSGPMTSIATSISSSCGASCKCCVRSPAAHWDSQAMDFFFSVGDFASRLTLKGNKDGLRELSSPVGPLPCLLFTAFPASTGIVAMFTKQLSILHLRHLSFHPQQPFFYPPKVVIEGRHPCICHAALLSHSRCSHDFHVLAHKH